MKIKLFCYLFFVVAFKFSFSQEVQNFVLVGENGITDNIKIASGFIVVKKYPTFYQRLDYKISSSLILHRTYIDSTLEILDGGYYEYSSNGIIFLKGEYKNNLRQGKWFIYDTLDKSNKVLIEEVFEKDSLIKTVNYDTVKEEKFDRTKLKDGEIEANYKTGDAGWRKFLQENLNIEALTEKTNKSGTVIVNFTIDVFGKLRNIHLDKSVDYFIDSEALRVIELASNSWIPATQNGKPVNAYRKQPISIQIDDGSK